MLPSAVVTKKKAQANAELLPSSLRTVQGEISLRSAVRGTFVVLAIAGGVLLIVLLQHVIVLLLLGLFLATIIDPGVKLLRRWGIQESLGILLHYAVFIAAALFLIFSLIPVIAEQVGGIAKLAQDLLQQLLTERTVALPFISAEFNVRLTVLLRMLLRNLTLNGPDALQQISVHMQSMAAGSLPVLGGLANSILTFLRDALIVMLSAFFIELDREQSYRWVRRFFPARMWPYLDARADLINEKLGQWIRGQLLLCLVIAILTFIVLLALGMPYALTLSLLAGFTEFIPYVGPLIGAIPAILIALGQGGPTWALVIIAAYYLIQFCENNFVVPLIMKHAVDMPATAIIIAMMVGVSFPAVIHPVLGILVAIPLASIIGIFLRDIRKKNMEKNLAL